MSPRSRWTFEAPDARSAVEARHAFVDYLRTHCAPESDFVASEIIFGELVANVVRHAPGPIRATVQCNDQCVLEVIDRGTGFQYRPRPVSDVMSETGRGLFLVANLSRELRFERDGIHGSRARVVLPVQVIG